MFHRKGDSSICVPSLRWTLNGVSGLRFVGGRSSSHGVFVKEEASYHQHHEQIPKIRYYQNPRRIASSEWILNVAGVPRVNMAGLVIYLVDFCNWKDDAVCHYQQSNGYRLFTTWKYTNIMPAIIHVVARRTRHTSLIKIPYLNWVFLHSNGRSYPRLLINF